MKRLEFFFWVTDLGFILYWLITLFHLIPSAYLFQDYTNPLLMAWNWSFLPLDLLVSASGLLSLALHRRRHPAWSNLALISLTLTVSSGLQAIAFWAIRQDFDWLWWAPNLYLLLYPCFFIPHLLFHSAKPGEEK